MKRHRNRNTEGTGIALASGHGTGKETMGASVRLAWTKGRHSGSIMDSHLIIDFYIDSLNSLCFVSHVINNR